MSGDQGEEFLDACGMTGPLRLTAERGVGRPAGSWSGSRPFAFIGRNAAADLRLDHESISRRHVYLQSIEGRLFAVDLGSRVGIRRGGQPLRYGWMEPGDGLGVGPYEVRSGGGIAVPAGGFGAMDDPPSPLSSRYRPGDGLPGVSLEISRAAEDPILWRMGRVLVLVGSAPRCKLRLVDLSVAPFQCSLVRTRSGLWVVDLLSDGGSFVNGEFARAARLEDGDELKVGRASIRVRLDDASRVGRGRSLQVFPAGPTPQVLSSMVVRMLQDPDRGAQLPTTASTEGWPEGDPTGMAPFVQQFGLVQRQMFDQFHQLMMGMMQAFGDMQREQMGAIREDLDRLEEITRELQELRSNAGDLPPGSSGRAGPGPASSSPSSGTYRPSTSLAEGRPVAGAKADPPPSDTSGVRRDRATRGVPHDAGPHLTSAGLSGPHPAEIVRKIQALQHERQGRWQRIVGFLLGAP